MFWDDLDRDKGILIVNRQLKRVQGEGLVLTSPKTQAKRRTIQLGSSTMNILNKHGKRQLQGCPNRPDGMVG